MIAFSRRAAEECARNNVGITGDCNALLVVEVEPFRAGLSRTRRPALRAALSAIRCNALNDVECGAAELLLLLAAAGVVERERVHVSASAEAWDMRTCAVAVSMSAPSAAL